MHWTAYVSLASLIVTTLLLVWSIGAPSHEMRHPSNGVTWVGGLLLLSFTANLIPVVWERGYTLPRYVILHVAICLYVVGKRMLVLSRDRYIEELRDQVRLLGGVPIAPARPRSRYAPGRSAALDWDDDIEGAR